MRTILLISPYWKESHRWMVSSVKLAELWRRLGYRVVVACMGEKTGVETVDDSLTIYRKKDVFLKDPWNYGIALGFSGMVRRIVREEQPDVIVCNKILFWTSFSLLSLWIRGKRAILLTDALVGMTWWPRGRIPQMCAAIYAWTGGWCILRAASRVVFFHPQPERLLKRLGIARKSMVIPTGIDPAPYAAPRMPDPQGRVTVTYVGRLESAKGVEDLLEAVHPLLAKHASLRVQVVGWHKPDHPLVARFGKEVLFTGLREDIPAVMAGTDIFVLPSYSEGLSNALMEAMASGCACVASDVGGNAFLIQNGVTGFLFPAGDRDALRSHLDRLIQDPAKRLSLGQAARKRIWEEFAWGRVGNVYGGLFEEVVK